MSFHPDDFFLRGVVDDLDDIIFTVDANGCWTFLNRAWETITGFGREDCLGRPAIDFVHPDDRAAGIELFGREWDREVRFRRHGGGFWRGKLRGRPMCDASGVPAGAGGSLTECGTGAAVAELRALRQMAETFLISECWAQEMEQTLRHLAPALGAERICLFELPSGKAGIRDARLSHAWPDGGATGEEPTATTPVHAGRRLWGQLAVYTPGREWSPAQSDGLRAAAGVIGAAIHRGESHAELQRASDRLRFVMSSSPVITFTSDPERDLALTWISENVEAVSGLPASMFVDNPHLWRDCVHPDDREAVIAANRTLALGTPSVSQSRYRHPSGEIRWMRCEMKLVGATPEKPAEVVGCLVDTTETMHALENLRYREAILQAVSFVARSFLYGQEWEDAIPAALERLGKASLADQVVLIQKVSGEGPTTIKLQHLWNAHDNRGPSVIFSGGTEAPLKPEFPPWEHTLDRGQVIAGCVSALSPAERAILEPEGIQAVAIVPIFVGSQRWGQIGFSRGADIPWLPATLDGLRVAAGIIGAAIQQTDSRHKLRRAQEELEDRVRRRTQQLAATNRALQDSEQLYRALVETCPDAILVSDLDHRIRMINPRGVELLRWEQADHVKDISMTSFYRPEDEDLVTRARSELLEQGRITAVEITVVRRDGSTFQAETSASLVRDPGGAPRYILRLVRDITARRQLEEQFRQAQKMEAIGRLAGGVAHDFNNLLTVIQGYGELLLKRVAGDPANSRKAAQIVRAAERAAALVEQLLAFSRRQMVEPKVVNVNAAIVDTEKMLRRLIGEDIEFITQLNPRTGSVRVDPGQLDQLIMNLAVNARDAMNAVGVLTISTSPVRVEADQEPPCAGMDPGAYVSIEVRDTGTGITEEVLSHMFEPFFTTKPVGKGTGLGLSTVYGVVQQSRGFIGVETAPGSGSAFRIYLPEVNGGADYSAPEQRPAGCVACHETVLVAEDSNSVRAMVVETLRECGYTVLEAIHGRHALEVAKQATGPIDLLLSDVVMPQMGGPELWNALSPGFPAMRLLFITGYADRELPANAPFLKKPFAPDALARRVREALDHS